MPGYVVVVVWYVPDSWPANTRGNCAG